MTSTTDTAGHPDVAEISDLTEGLLPPDRSSDVRRHLGTCELCADMYASLEEIRSLLGSVQEPERMPDDVAARIGAALAAEVPRAGGEGTADHVSRETATVADRPAGRPRATTGPGRKPSERGRRRGRFVLGAVLTAAVLGGGGLVVTSLGDNAGHTTTAHGTPTPSAVSFSGDSLQNQVRGLLAMKKGLPQDSEKPRSDTEGGSDTPGVTSGTHTLIQTAVPVPDCVRQALSRGADVLGAKTGTYAGRPAYLVVVADARDTKRVTAYVVDEACVRQRSTAAGGEVLLKQSVARP
ncbi:hypothetical protein [Streptomyces sp. AGS-58]|uniref:hypothetical protein n=1 Tax=unclassified Streptomyces TaxID=2593676 RepID=UPI0035A2B0E9